LVESGQISEKKGVGWVWIQEEKPTANRKSKICSPTRFARLNRRTRKPLVCSPLRVFDPRLNPALRAPRIGFAIPHSRKPAMQSCSSLIGSGLATKSTTLAEQIVRFARPFGQILSPPQRLLWEKKVFFDYISGCGEVTAG
jgi:hypothetical protein